MRRWRPVLVLFLVLGACSGDDQAPTVETTSTTTPAPTTTADLSIDGEGFFVVRRDQEIFFARGATVALDDARRLAADGTLLQGWPVGDDGTIDVNGPILDLVAASGFEIDERGVVTVGERTIGQLAIALFGAPGGLEAVDGWLLRPTASSGLAALSTVGVERRGSVVVEGT